MTNKAITFGIPCYNSAEYMDHCITSILEGTSYADDVQIVIVDDGSTKDNTPQKADEWAARYPNIIKAVHQENGGHGMAVLAGLNNADGAYYKVVDSDDWLDGPALTALLDRLRMFLATEEQVDLIVTNYVYEHVSDSTRHVVDYRGILPEQKVITWDQTGHFQMSHSLLMHALCYRTEVLRSGDLPLPAHTFYVDNIYAWVPLPRCKTLYYMDVDLYRYYIGRDDQSVNEEVMAGRIDQQVRITRIMMHAYHLYTDIPSVYLRSYMVNYYVLMMTICTVFSKLSKRPDAMSELHKLWHELHEYDPRLWRRCRMGVCGLATNLPGKVGNLITMGIYRLTSKIVKFN